MTANWRADAASWWSSKEWHCYEKEYGDEPGARSRLLAEATWRTRIMSLDPSEAELWSSVRKSYRSLIHAGEHRYEIRLGAGLSLLYAQRLHFEAAGCATRSQATWGRMREWIHEDHGVLMMATDRGSGEARSYAYFIVNGSWSYYASGASLEDDVQHAVIWRALLALKARGVCVVELGWQGQAPDAKGRGVEFFKTGFGGRDVPARLGARGDFDPVVRLVNSDYVLPPSRPARLAVRYECGNCQFATEAAQPFGACPECGVVLDVMAAP